MATANDFNFLGLQNGANNHCVYRYNYEEDTFTQQQSLLEAPVNSAVVLNDRIYGLANKQPYRMISRLVGGAAPEGNDMYILLKVKDSGSLCGSYSADDIATIGRQSVKSLLPQP